MNRIFRKIIVCIMIIILVVTGSIPASACNHYDSEGKNLDEVVDDPRYWWQGRVPAFNEPITPGSDTVGWAACSSFAMTYCLVKMGIYHIDEGDNPEKLIKEAREKNMYSNGWYFDYCNIGRLYPEITCINDFDYGVQGKGVSDALDYVKGLMAEGKYVIACVNAPQGGHMIFFDGVTEDGKIVIGDSAYRGLDWDTTYGAAGSTLQYVVVFEYKELSTDMPSIYDDVELRRNRKADQLDIEKKNILVKEWDLEGMPRKPFIADKMGLMTTYDYELALDFEEKLSLASLQENMQNDDVSLLSVVSVVLDVFGLVLVVYAILLILAFFLDRFFFLEFSLVGVLTLGNIRIMNDSYYNEFDRGAHNRGYFSHKKFFVIVLVIVLMGIFLISGIALKFVSMGAIL